MKRVSGFLCLTILGCVTSLASAGLEPNSIIRSTHYIVKESRLRGLLSTDRENFKGPRWGAGQILEEGHKIEQGKSFVIRIQTFHDPEIYYVDEERFEKLSLEIKNYQGSRIYKLPSNDVQGFYSQGSQVWGLGDYSEKLEGTVEIEESNPETIGPHFPEWHVHVDLTATLVNAHDPTRKSSKRIQGSYHCPLVTVDQLEKRAQ